ncbi:MAG: hypothetical protein GVY36_11940 [Verrucomicrobia bacterium]|jgi:hypothetical protein|nr:hypothetical protein [Verrucomicrobiota bacterium]
MLPRSQKPLKRLLLAAAFVLVLSSSSSLRGEVILQYFNVSWNEIAEKMPELAEAGYDALWLPPPTKGSGGLSVGFDLWDPFDLGNKDQRNTVSTRYGTMDDLLRLVEVAHRFGIRVYFDNIMNHRAFDVPGFNENTPIGVYPGMIPEDFHLRVTEEGFYRKWDNTRDWNSQWQVQNLGLADLIDIAHETPNTNFGPNEGDTHPKVTFLRHPDNPEYYAYLPGTSGTSHAAGDGVYVGFGPGNGITAQTLADNEAFYSEDVGALLIRAVRWKMATTKADGLRLDAVKHVPSYFFGQQSGDGKDASSAGYLGGVQVQYNLTRGFSDWDNHRDTVFSSESPRDDALVFGEHLGSPPGFQEYIDAGMRLLDAPLHREMNGRLGNPGTGLNGLDTPGWSGNPTFNDNTGISFAQSHDDDFASRRELQHAFYLTRRGIANVYTDGYYKAETLGESGGAFPRHANNPFLGQFGDPRLPNLLQINEHFGRGAQIPRWSDGDVVAYERRDKRENPGMSDPDGTVLLFMMNDNFADGQARPIDTTFPAVSGGTNAYLYNYATPGGGFYVWASDIEAGNVIVPPGGYFAFSWKNPDPAALWTDAGGQTLSILQNGAGTETVRVTRRDGPDGDPQFNPLGLPNRGYLVGETPEPFTYQVELPRVTDGSDLRFVLRTDGSTAGAQFKLDGGIDINSHLGLGPQTGDLRDNPPAIATDTFLGYEDANFVQRQHAEKFAAVEASRSQIGSLGAETYSTTIGSGSFVIVPAPDDVNADFETFGGNAASFIFHDPDGSVGGDDPADPGVGDPQFDDSGSELTVWAKTNSVGGGYRMIFYYTTDGTNPEGAGGDGLGTTRTAELNFQHNDDSGSNDWWGSASIPKPAPGTELRYKIGIFRDGDGAGGPLPDRFPVGPAEVEDKARMMSVFDIAGFDATNAFHYPHNDYGETRVGLAEGWHVLRGRAYLDRFGRAAIYRTFTQPFYYDTQRPTGEILFPANNGDTVSGQEFGVVVRTDAEVTEVWYAIEDDDPANDDVNTGVLNGNGSGFEPFTDSDRNGEWDPGELFTDLNANGVWDGDVGTSWVRATEVTATPVLDSDFPKEWRFDYTNIPAIGNANIRVRLREVSSVERTDFTESLSDTDGHFTTLTRNVATAGPDTRLFIRWPAQNGDIVGSGYVLKAYFSKSLADGLSEAELIENFTLRIQSEQSGQAEGGVAQNRDDYRINFNETADFHALAFDLPNLFNGRNDWLHGIEVTLDRDGAPDLVATRLVRAFPTPPPPRVDIVNPLEIGPDGRPVEIVLPDLVAPDPEDRQFLVRVKTDDDIDTLDLNFNFAPEDFSGTLTLRTPTDDNPNPVVEGNSLFHEYVWSGILAGQYRFTATVDRDGETNSTVRNATVFFRQVVDFDDSGDSDDDGLPDAIESEPIRLPEGNPETWTNGQVHSWIFSGKTQATRPQTDGSLLPDGLQLGLIGPIDSAATDTTTDTNGDGFTNFLSDLDPPLFNTTDNSGHPRYDLNRGRTDLIDGTMTDPVKADSDDDSLRDDQEDRNRNGRVDIGALGPDGKVTAILGRADIPTFYNTSRIDRDSLPPNARFLETDPNNDDTIGDGLRDGQGDANRNGRLDLFLLQSDGSSTPLDYTNPGTAAFAYNRMPNDSALLDWDNQNPPPWHVDGIVYPAIRSRALHREALLADYAADGSGTLQDENGWPRILITETDPLRLDTIGDGLPDGWKVRFGLDPLDDGTYNWRTGQPGDPLNGPGGDLTGDGITNLDHFNAGTDPRSTITPGPPPDEAIIIGPGPSLGTINGVTYFQEFMDWKHDDLIALDEYEGDGFNNQGGDLFPGFDGFDSSRDIVAFYARDGGDSAVGGDDSIYFRLDFDDLRPFAEEGFLNIYVAINQNPGTGERVLPDEVDTLTDMRWRTLVAVYNSTNGRIFADTDPANNTDNFGEDLFSGNGVEIYDQDHPKGFQGAYFNSELDAVEFAISREALLDAGWLGSNFGQLNFQVYTTRDNTENSPQGSGDIGGRSDLRDTVYDDRVVENNFFSQAGREDILKSSFSKSNRPAANQRVQTVLLSEGNQHLLPGHEIQEKINDGAGAGYHRVVLAHRVFQSPLSLSITPTLASAIQWAAVDPAAGKPWRDGPAFNLGLRNLADAGHLFLLGTTFAGHVPNYTTAAFDAANIDTAHHLLFDIYGIAPSDDILYLPERTADDQTLQRLNDLQFTHTLLDQREHIESWFGRTEALGDNGYRINRIHGIDTFVIHDRLSDNLFANTDGGAPTQIRRVLSRKSRAGEQQQVVTLLSSLEDFTTATRADAYERNLRWLANRPWVEVVTPQDLIDRSWSAVDRGAPNLPLVAKNFVQYASQGSYDNWYSGNADREGLAGKIFERAPGQTLPGPFGQIGQTGLAEDAWQAISALDPADGIGQLAHATAGAALFTTAFHNQGFTDLRKFSTGDYINPASGFETLAGFAATAQAHFRHAAIYGDVANWAASADTLSGTVAVARDLTLDGVDNYLLYNRHVLAVFDRLGGRLLASWVRDADTGRVFQTTGNLLAFADGPDDFEGTENGSARRTSGFKDWFASGSGGSSYVNAPYNASPAGGAETGWTFSSSDGNIAKTITLADDSRTLEASYDLDPVVGTLFVRFGLSPDLRQLMISGQSHLGAPTDTGSHVRVTTQGPQDIVSTRLHYAGSSYNANWISDATDDPDDRFDTVNLRNQALTQQLEFSGSGQFSIGLELDAAANLSLDTDSDGLPDWWETLHFDDAIAADPSADPDGDGLTNLQEFIFGTHPKLPNVYQLNLGTTPAQDVTVQFQTIEDRTYTVYYSHNLIDWDVAQSGIVGTGSLIQWTDDGSQTGTHPATESRRFYRIQVELPE